MEASGVSIPEQAEAVSSVGTVNQINLEQVVALSPDLVIGQPRFHKELVQSLESSGIPIALMSLSSYEDMKAKAEWVSKLAGTEEQLPAKLQAFNKNDELSYEYHYPISNYINFEDLKWYPITASTRQ